MSDLNIIFELHFEEAEADGSFCDLCHKVMIGKMYHLLTTVEGNPLSVDDLNAILCEECRDDYRAYKKMKL